MSEFTWENLESTEPHQSVIGDAEGLMDAAREVESALSDLSDAIFAKDVGDVVSALQAIVDAQGQFSQTDLYKNAESLMGVVENDMQTEEDDEE